VLKPSPFTPRAAARIAEIVARSYRECTSDGGDPEEIKKPLHFFGVALYSAMIR